MKKEEIPREYNFDITYCYAEIFAVSEISGYAYPDNIFNGYPENSDIRIANPTHDVLLHRTAPGKFKIEFRT